jgi:hypothetical protein
MKTKTLAFLIGLTLLIAACVPLGGSATLNPGESYTSGDGNVTVTVLQVLEDSRCPADAMCIWQGNVKVLVEITVGTETQQATLTLGELLDGDVTSVTIAGHTVELTQVEPYPLASQPTDPADYEVTLKIS